MSVSLHNWMVPFRMNAAWPTICRGPGIVLDVALARHLLAGRQAFQSGLRVGRFPWTSRSRGPATRRPCGRRGLPEACASHRCDATHGGYTLGGDRRADGRRRFDVLGQDVFEAGSSKRTALCAEKQFGSRTLSSYGEPRSEHSERFLPEGQDTLSATLAADVDRGLRMCLHLVEPKPDKFGNSESGGKAEVKHGAITSSKTGRRIRGVQQGL